MFVGADLAGWAVGAFQRYPWAVSGGMVILVGALGAVVLQGVGLWRRRRSRAGLRIRSQPEQRRFEVVGTHYAPRQYRRGRERG